MLTKTLQRAFSGGEMSPHMYGHVDDPKVLNGLARCRNQIPLATGPAVRRPRFDFIAAVKDSSTRPRLIDFKSDDDDGVLIEWGVGYLRFYVGGELLRLTGTPAAYVPNKAFADTAISGAANTITFGSAHAFTSGDPARVTNDGGGAAPPNNNGVTTSTRVFVNVVSSTVVRLCLTQADAIAGTNIVDLTAPPGSTNYRLNYAYVPGDLVEGTPAGAAGNHYCIVEPTVNGAAQITPGNATYWYALTDDIYEIPHGMAADDVQRFTFRQVNDVLAFTERTGPPYELRRYGETRWVFERIRFEPSLPAPTITSIVPNFGVLVAMRGSNDSGAFDELETLGTPQPEHGYATGEIVWLSLNQNGTGALAGIGPGPFVVERRSATNLRAKAVVGGAIAVFSGSSSGFVRYVGGSWENSETYVVTAIDESGRESKASAEVSQDNNLAVPGSYNTIVWSAVEGAVRYRVYKKQAGLFGRIGESDSTTFKDDNIGFGPDLALTPPRVDDALSGTDYPEAITAFESSYWFGGSTALPQNLWKTRTNTRHDLSYHIPQLPTDRISVDLSLGDWAQIRHLVGTKHLIVFTSTGEYRITPLQSDAITPDSITVRNESNVGAARVRPLIAGGSVLFVGARDHHVYAFAFQDGRGFDSIDVSLRAGHLFDGGRIEQSAQQKAPYPLQWWNTSSGLLLSLTWLPEQGVDAWAWHDLGIAGAVVESIACVQEGQQDRLYAMARMTIDGSPVRYILRMGEFAVGGVALGDATAFHADLGGSYSGAPVSVITGLDHLEGLTLAVVTDGFRYDDLVVTGGEIELDDANPAASVHWGVPFRSEAVEMPTALAIEAFANGREIAAVKSWLRVVDSGQFYVGPLNTEETEDAAADAARQDAMLVPVGAADALFTGRHELSLLSDWTPGGQLVVRTDGVEPLNLVSLTKEVSVA